MDRMTNLSHKIIRLKKALDTLEEALGKYENLSPDHMYYKELRDSIIQRFEYSLDTFWKVLKYVLETQYGLSPVATPKTVLEAAAERGLIQKNELQLCAGMVDDRNLTSHAYNVSVAEKIATAIPNYYRMILTIVERIEFSLSP